MEIIFLNKRTKKFHEGLGKLLKGHVIQIFDMLKDKAHLMSMPFSRPLGGGLFELRIVDDLHVRYIYAFFDGHIWMLHGFIKKTGAISKQDLDYARGEHKRLLSEYNK